MQYVLTFASAALNATEIILSGSRKIFLRDATPTNLPVVGRETNSS
jgi:hypothetical protein